MFQLLGNRSTRRPPPPPPPSDRSMTNLPTAATPASLGVARAQHQRRSVDELDRLGALHGWGLEHLAGSIGTVVHGIDLRAAASPVEAAALRLLFAERKVLFFREQPLTRPQHLAAAQLFGELEPQHPFAAIRGLGYEHPEGIKQILRIVHDEESVGVENNW